jgi:hypothetical protein
MCRGRGWESGGSRHATAGGAAFTGADFDRRYAGLEVLDHEQHGSPPRELRPATLREHLKLSREILHAVGG